MVRDDDEDAEGGAQGSWWELVLLFGGGSLALFVGRHAVAGIFFPGLWLVAGLVWWHLRRDRTFDGKRLWRWEGRGWWRNEIGIPLGIGVPLLVGGLALFAPERLFDLPRERTGLWLAILLLYPLFSVIPQELVFRAFLHHRYRSILSDRGLRILVSAIAFGLAHAFFGNWEAPLLSTLGGLLFARTYERTTSIWPVAIEHAIWGDVIMTIGLGSSFYAGNVV